MHVTEGIESKGVVVCTDAIVTGEKDVKFLVSTTGGWRWGTHLAGDKLSFP